MNSNKCRVSLDNSVTPAYKFQHPSGHPRKPYAGRQAEERCRSPELLIEDFKLELGKEDLNAPSRRSTPPRHTQRLTTVGLGKDFFDQILGKMSRWLEAQGQPLPKRILVAEPLSLGSERGNEDWLKNYRRSVRQALYGRFDEIDFLPEPFAVFQYYRHGVGRPLVAANRKHVALVLDFGGGTFDVSVIETTKQGDISKSTVQSQLGAKSMYLLNPLGRIARG